MCQHQPDLTPDSVRLKLASWVPSHFAWIKSVGKAFLGEKKIDIMQYLDALICTNFIYDELGFFFARLMCVDINIITTKQVWSTKRIRKIHLPEITLAFFGKSKFPDTREWLLPPTDYIILENAFKKELGEVETDQVFLQDSVVNKEIEDVGTSHVVFPDTVVKKELNDFGTIDYVPHEQVVVGSIHLKTESSKSEGLLPDSDHSSAQEVEVPQQNIDVQDTVSQDINPNLSESEEQLPDDTLDLNHCHSVSSDHPLNVLLLSHIVAEPSCQEMLTECFISLKRLTV